MEQIRIVKEMREHDKLEKLRSGGADVDIRPRFMVWENVCGAFSSNGGEDFRAVLEEAAKVSQGDAVIPEPPNGKWPSAGLIMGDGWSIAWRVHDAQYWGVPQRRKRVCMLCDFNGGSAGDILFECWRETENPETDQTEPNLREESRPEIQPFSESVSGHSESSGTAGQETAGDAGNGFEKTGGGVLSFQERAGKPGGGKGLLIAEERVNTLNTQNNQSVCVKCLNDQGGAQMSVTEDQTGTLRAEEHGHQPLVFGISAYDSNAMKSPNPNSGIYEADTARTLDLNGGSPACNQGGMAVVCIEGNGARESHKGDGFKESETMYTLNTVKQHAVAYGLDRASFNQGQNAQYNFAVEEEVAPTLVAKGPGGVLKL